MPTDLTVQAISAVRAAGNTADTAKAAMPNVAPQPAQATTAVSIPNPTLRFDSGLGLVVIEFRNDSGVVSTSVPSERQIAAYQKWQRTKFGPVPEGMPEPGVNGTPRPATPEPAPKPAPAAHEKAVK